MEFCKNCTDNMFNTNANANSTLVTRDYINKKLENAKKNTEIYNEIYNCILNKDAKTIQKILLKNDTNKVILKRNKDFKTNNFIIVYNEIPSYVIKYCN